MKGADIDTIATLTPPAADSNVVLAGSKLGARIVATSAGGTVLYARGALVATTTGHLAVWPSNSGFFSASDQVAVSAGQPRAASVVFTATTGATVDVPYTVVARDDLTEIGFGEPGELDLPDDTEAFLVATGEVGGVVVCGGPVCDWTLVSGGPDTQLTPYPSDDTESTVLSLTSTVRITGHGPNVVQCRANATVAPQLGGSLTGAYPWHSSCSGTHIMTRAEEDTDHDLPLYDRSMSAGNADALFDERGEPDDDEDLEDALADDGELDVEPDDAKD